MRQLLSTEDASEASSGSYPLLDVAEAVIANACHLPPPSSLAVAFSMNSYGEKSLNLLPHSSRLSNDPQRCPLPNAQHLSVCLLT